MNESMVAVELGRFSLVLAFLVSGYAFTFSILGGKLDKRRLVASTESSMHAIFILLSIASGALIHALVNHNFAVKYVYSHTSRSLETFYTVSAFWAGQEGSLLFWVLMLAFFSSIVVFQNRHKNRDLMPYVVAVLSFTIMFFLFLMIFSTNPFATYPSTPADGHGLNPLLQNPGMTWHPPTLFLGYVGFTIPFAFSIGALVTGNLGNTWIKSTRRWTIFAWLMLSIGILLGMQWAYVELGWGGYWGWDPVENASFFPWLAGTAYLHSVMIQEKRGMLKTWNIVLVILTFFLCIFGTFLTRTDLVSSVHTFGDSNLGPSFMVFMIIIVAVSYGLMFSRLDDLKSKNELDSLLSREATFLLNNLALMSILVAVLIGTLFPAFSKMLTGNEISLRAPFFNRVNIPLALVLLLLMGVCPLIAWRKATLKNFERNFLRPFLISAALPLILYVFGVTHPVALVSYTFSLFVTVAIVIEFVRGTEARHNLVGEGYLLALGKLIWKNKRRYGGYIVHLGMVMIFFGITASSAHNIEKEATLSKGESFSIRNYKITYENYDEFETSNKLSMVAKVRLDKDGETVEELYPEKNLFKGEDQPVTEIALHWNLVEDFYLIFSGVDANGRASFRMLINPFLVWIWIGGVVLAIGSLIALLPSTKKITERV